MADPIVTDNDSDSSTGIAQSVGPTLGKEQGHAPVLQPGQIAQTTPQTDQLLTPGKELDLDQAREKDREGEKPGLVQLIGKALGLDKFMDGLPAVVKTALGIQQDKELAKNTPDAAKPDKEKDQEKPGPDVMQKAKEPLVVSAAMNKEYTTAGQGLDNFMKDAVSNALKGANLGSLMGAVSGSMMDVNNAQSGQLSVVQNTGKGVEPAASPALYT